MEFFFVSFFEIYHFLKYSTKENIIKHLIDSKVCGFIINEPFQVLLQLHWDMIDMGHVISLQEWHWVAFILTLPAFFEFQYILFIES